MISELTKKIFFDGVTLSVAQGTTEDFEIEIEDESTGKKYVPTASTKVVFGMKKNREDSDILVSKIKRGVILMITSSVAVNPA